MAEIIHVVTPLSRPQNIEAIRGSLGLLPWDWRWWVFLDQSRVPDPPGPEAFPVGTMLLTMESNGSIGSRARNSALETITDGVLLWLDDDNLIHPNIGNVLRRLDDPDVDGVVCHVQKKNGDFWACPSGPKDDVDTAGIIFRRDAIGPVRWIEEKYDADQDFHRNVSARARLLYVPEVGAYWNALAPEPRGSA